LSSNLVIGSARNVASTIFASGTYVGKSLVGVPALMDATMEVHLLLQSIEIRKCPLLAAAPPQVPEMASHQSVFAVSLRKSFGRVQMLGVRVETNGGLGNIKKQSC
jgi:hypothetical protein